MANSGSSTTRPTPRLYKRHQRHDVASRESHSHQEQEFLRVQAARLSTTTAIVFAKLTKYSAERIVSAANLAAIP